MRFQSLTSAQRIGLISLIIAILAMFALLYVKSRNELVSMPADNFKVLVVDTTQIQQPVKKENKTSYEKRQKSGKSKRKGKPKAPARNMLDDQIPTK
jgi:hypothetical protein